MNQLSERMRQEANNFYAEYWRSGWEGDEATVESVLSALRDGAKETERLSTLVYGLALALKRMTDMYSDIMRKTRLAQSVSDLDLLRELHDAPIQAARALASAEDEPDVDAYIARLNASPGGEHA